MNVLQCRANPFDERSSGSVNETLRVVRLNRRTPRFASSFATALLSAVVDMPEIERCGTKRTPTRDGDYGIEVVQAGPIHCPIFRIRHPTFIPLIETMSTTILGEESDETHARGRVR